MLMQITESKIIPPGSYVASVKSIAPDRGDYGEQLAWVFTLLSPAALAGAEVKAWSSTSTSTKGKAAIWAGACLGRPLTSADELDTDDLTGKRVLVNIVEKVSDDGTVFSKVDGLRLYKPKTRPAPVVEVEDPDNPDPFVAE